jgi:hypothetical protein
VTARVNSAIFWSPVILLLIFAFVRMTNVPLYLQLVREDHLLEWIQSLT